jgi:hypothetical protein
MRVDAARDDDLPRGVDDSPRAEGGKAARRTDRGDFFASNADIGGLGTGGKDSGAAGDDDVEQMKPPNAGEAPTLAIPRMRGRAGEGAREREVR